jgi:hypothetical protein
MMNDILESINRIRSELDELEESLKSYTNFRYIHPNGLIDNYLVDEDNNVIGERCNDAESPLLIDENVYNYGDSDPNKKKFIMQLNIPKDATQGEKPPIRIW